MLDKSYEPAAVEPRIAKCWEDAGAFAAGAGAEPGAEAYSIVIPPPNVTGSLHMGHALNNTLQDILVRFERMRGKNVLWQAGTDHAGIATQMVVERQLAAKGKTRRGMTREEFTNHIWDWKAESGGTIVNQLKRLGASCDWSRLKFTMGEAGNSDDQMVRAVTEVFVQLYNTRNENGQRLIYRGKRLVNWDPKFETAISDLEVENIEVDGHMWHFKYPLAGGETFHYIERDADGNITFEDPKRDYISIATTRPETMLGDGAVAVHTDDARYAPIVGKLCEIPVGPKPRRQIKIIKDEYPDMNFGSGAVKITGAHDFNDYQVAKRNNIPMYRLMDTKGCMRADGSVYAVEAGRAEAVLAAGGVPDEVTVDSINIVPDKYRGLKRFAEKGEPKQAREQIIDDINAENLAVMIANAEGVLVPFVEDKKVMQPFGDRSRVVIEPMLTDQWFCDAETLAKPAIEAVKSGRTKFVPENWDKTYFQWMENIQPWCISRQLWWGHQIPAWYGVTKQSFPGPNPSFSNFEITLVVEKNFALAGQKASNDHYNGEPVFEVENFSAAMVELTNNKSHLTGKGWPVWRDPDVLDTWFSSALWPFSTLGWPDKTPELDTYYQTDVLVTGFDIIFFWVARMMMMGMHFMKDADGNPVEPFHTVYVHALVRDKDGQKMSKSKGNVIDPLDLIDEFGADALRFTMAIMAAQGRDVKLDPTRIAGYRNFGSKIWNATRFAEMNDVARDAAFKPVDAKLTLNRWVLSELTAANTEITKQIEAYRFNDASAAAYRFVWNVVCDWYVELLKPVFFGDDEAAKAECRATFAYVLDAIYALLHPFMPFMTEELWALRAGETPRDRLLVHSAWPTETFADEAAAAEINWLIEIVTAIRSTRAEMNVAPANTADLVVVGGDAQTQKWAKAHEGAFGKLARVAKVVFADEPPKASAQIVAGGATLCLPLGQLIDFAAEKARLEKALGKIEADASKIESKLGNAAFVANAREDVVIAERTRLAELLEQKAQTEAALERILQAAS